VQVGILQIFMVFKGIIGGKWVTEKIVEVKLVDGLIAKASAMFVQKANRYTADIHLERDGQKVDAKSIMGLMSLSIAPGEEVTIITDGVDGEIALRDLVTFLSKEVI